MYIFHGSVGWGRYRDVFITIYCIFVLSYRARTYDVRTENGLVTPVIGLSSEVRRPRICTAPYPRRTGGKTSRVRVGLIGFATVRLICTAIIIIRVIITILIYIYIYIRAYVSVRDYRDELSSALVTAAGTLSALPPVVITAAPSIIYTRASWRRRDLLFHRMLSLYIYMYVCVYKYVQKRAAIALDALLWRQPDDLPRHATMLSLRKVIIFFIKLKYTSVRTPKTCFSFCCHDVEDRWKLTVRGTLDRR